MAGTAAVAAGVAAVVAGAVTRGAGTGAGAVVLKTGVSAVSVTGDATGPCVGNNAEEGWVSSLPKPNKPPLFLTCAEAEPREIRAVRAKNRVGCFINRGVKTRWTD
jgi:hypothetical protein